MGLFFRRGLKPADKSALIDPAKLKVLWVDADHGSDREGAGTETAPFATITKALMAARKKAVIRVAPGTYSELTGEAFPMRFDGVQIEGMGDGKKIIQFPDHHQGFGIEMSGTASLTGFSILGYPGNSHGIGIAGGKPILRGNTIVGNICGIIVSGDAAPLIEGNAVSGNTEGIRTQDRCAPVIRGNTIAGANRGVIAEGESRPRIEANIVHVNDVGITTGESSAPVIRHNQMTDNHSYCVYILHESNPDMGTMKDPGGNTLLRSGFTAELRNKTANAVLAIGNTWDGGLNAPQGRKDIKNTGGGSVIYGPGKDDVIL